MKRGDTEPTGIVFCQQPGAAALMDAYFQAEEEHIAQEAPEIQQVEVPQALIDRCQAQIHRQLQQKSRSECPSLPGTASKVAAGVAVAATIVFGSVCGSAMAAQPLTLQYEFVAETDSIRLFFGGRASYLLSGQLHPQAIRELLPAGYAAVPLKDDKTNGATYFRNDAGEWIRYQATPATGSFHISITNLRCMEQTSMQGCPAVVLERYAPGCPQIRFMTELYWIDRSANMLYSLDSTALSQNSLKTIAEQIILRSR